MLLLALQLDGSAIDAGPHLCTRILYPVLKGLEYYVCVCVLQNKRDGAIKVGLRAQSYKYILPAPSGIRLGNSFFPKLCALFACFGSHGCLFRIAF
jgi:hypothetical protein